MQVQFSIHAGEDETDTVRRLLWKFGYNLPRYDEECSLLRERISQYKMCALDLPSTPSEGDRARVRSVGVNLFVSTEQFLEDMVCYNIWMLASDHFTGTGFSYNKGRALALVPEVLGSRLVSGQEAFEWSTEGSNTLGCLLAYLEAFRKWTRSRRDADKTPLVRSKDDYPHYAKDALWVFPFKHKALWADSDPEVIAVYADAIDRICTQLSQADLLVVRNGLDHKRDEEAFPDADKLLACASRLQQVLDIADSQRLIPKLFWGVRAEKDNDGNVCDTFHDCRGIPVSLYNPGACSGILERKFGVPYLIAPFDFLSQPNSLLVFTRAPDSVYRQYWENYPRRRFVPTQRPNGDAQCAEMEHAAQESPVDLLGLGVELPQ
jgi:hypothetical protein